MLTHWKPLGKVFKPPCTHILAICFRGVFALSGDCHSQPFNSFEHRKHTAGISNHQKKIKKNSLLHAFLSYSQRFDDFVVNNAMKSTQSCGFCNKKQRSYFIALIISDLRIVFAYDCICEFRDGVGVISRLRVSARVYNTIYQSTQNFPWRGKSRKHWDYVEFDKNMTKICRFFFRNLLIISILWRYVVFYLL